MRLYDMVAAGHCRSDPELPSPAILPRTVVIHADSIFKAEWLSPLPEAYPHLVMPFNNTFIEGRIPTGDRAGWLNLVINMDNDDERNIVMEHLETLVKLFPEGTGSAIVRTGDSSLDELLSSRWIQLHWHFTWQRGRSTPSGPVGLIGLGLNDQGHAIGTSHQRDGLTFINCRGFSIASPKVLAQYGAAVAHGQLYRNASPLWQTASLLHCKNIALEAHDPPHALARKHMRKHGIALHRYYTLRVSTPSGQKRTGAATGGHADLPQHIVRGHFKTYTSDKPLFGALTGTYWWPAHARGDREHGTITKDYEVVLPE